MEEVGENFPYKNAKELFSAASTGQLSLPKMSTISTLQADAIRGKVSLLKEKSMQKIDLIFENALMFAKNPVPDAESKVHYQKLKGTLEKFPRTSEEWVSYRSTMENRINEMSLLAAKLDEEVHHHHEEHTEPVLSIQQQFEQKYGKNLDDMQELLSKYKQNPEGFFESSILEKYGKTGFDILTKSQEFSSNVSVMNESDKSAAESLFKDFLKTV